MLPVLHPLLFAMLGNLNELYVVHERQTCFAKWALFVPAAFDPAESSYASNVHRAGRCFFAFSLSSLSLSLSLSVSLLPFFLSLSLSLSLSPSLFCLFLSQPTKVKGAAAHTHTHTYARTHTHIHKQRLERTCSPSPFLFSEFFAKASPANHSQVASSL